MTQETRSKTKKALEGLVAAAKDPMALMYATSFSFLNGVIQTVQRVSSRNNHDFSTSVVDSVVPLAKNFVFFYPVNMAYAKAVDYATRKSGRLAANLVCLATNAAFYGYSLATSDTNPAVPAAITTGLGLYLTNQQVSLIQKHERERGLIST